MNQNSELLQKLKEFNCTYITFYYFIYFLGYQCQRPKVSYGRPYKLLTTATFTIAFIVMSNLKIYFWRKMVWSNFAILVLLGSSVSIWNHKYSILVLIFFFCKIPGDLIVYLVKNLIGKKVYSFHWKKLVYFHFFRSDYT